MTLLFAIQKLTALIERSDPILNESVITKHYGPENGLDLNKAGLHFAFSSNGLHD